MSGRADVTDAVFDGAAARLEAALFADLTEFETHRYRKRVGELARAIFARAARRGVPPTPMVMVRIVSRACARALGEIVSVRLKNHPEAS